MRTGGWINLFDDGRAGRKGEPAEERDEQLSFEFTNPGRDGLDCRCADGRGVRDWRESSERLEDARVNVGLPHQIAATIGDIKLVADQLQIERIRSLNVRGRRGSRIRN